MVTNFLVGWQINLLRLSLQNVHMVDVHLVWFIVIFLSRRVVWNMLGQVMCKSLLFKCSRIFFLKLFRTEKLLKRFADWRRWPWPPCSESHCGRMFLFFLTFKVVPNVLNLPRLIVAKEKIHKSLQPPLPHLPPHESTFRSYLLPLIN